MSTCLSDEVYVLFEDRTGHFVFKRNDDDLLQDEAIELAMRFFLLAMDKKFLHAEISDRFEDIDFEVTVAPDSRSIHIALIKMSVFKNRIHLFFKRFLQKIHLLEK